jgi:hypothetical protein
MRWRGSRGLELGRQELTIAAMCSAVLAWPPGETTSSLPIPASVNALLKATVGGWRSNSSRSPTVK